MKHAVDWTDFSMRPVHPLQVDNPVTRTVNMVRTSSGAWKRRAGFASKASPGASVLNHVCCELGGVSMLVAKCADGRVRYWNGVSWNTLGAFVDANDKPVGLDLWSTSERGSLEIHAGELYACDSKNIAVYDGNASNQLRRPGVKSLGGFLYYQDGAKPTFNLAKVGGAAATKFDLFDDFKAIEDSPLASDGTDPGLVLLEGEKVLNTGFAFSIYDPKRQIYGKRSEVCALPFVFGPPNPNSEDALLTDERMQYAKQIRTPGSPTFVPPGMRVAVWFTIGTEIITNKLKTLFSGFFFFFNQNAPAMSPRMTSVLFLEMIADAGQTVICRKDQATLFNSERYVDAYARPSPAKLLVILPNGTAIYVFPRTDPDNASSTIGNYAEWSVDHPEQVGRLTENNRDTNGPIANLKADPLYSISDADRSMILTRQTMYQVGFDGRAATFADATNGRGIAAIDSICVSGAGVFWMADEGLVALRGGAIALLDKKLGFGDWFDGLNDAQRSAVAIGACERTSHLIASMHDFENLGPTTRRCMVFDWEYGSQCEFRIADAVNPYRFGYFRGASNSRLLAFSTGAMHAYPEGDTDAGTFYDSFIEMWLTEDAANPKTMQEVVLSLGASNGTLSVTCDAYEHPEVATPYVANRTETAVIPVGGARRLIVPNFVGMRGRLFRVTVKSSGAGAATSWSISRAQVNYRTDDDGDARSI